MSEDAPLPIDPGPPPRDPREAWSSPYRGVDFDVTLKWLALGALIYALLLLVAMKGNPRDATLPIVGPSLYLTPIYGLPYVLATLNRPGRTRRILFFFVLLPIVHIAANYVAWRYAVYNFEPMDTSGDLVRNAVTGGLGGLVGGSLAFALLKTVRLSAPHRSQLFAMVVAVILLSAIGAAGMAAGLEWTNALHDRANDIGRKIIWYETVHFPWQLAFALMLAVTMHKPRPKRPKRVKFPPAEPEPEGSDSQAVADRMRGSISAE